jgi:hypothetical protein
VSCTQTVTHPAQPVTHPAQPATHPAQPSTAVTPATALVTGVTGATRYRLYVPKSYSSSGMAAPVAAGLCPKGFLVTPSPLPS